MKTDSSKTRQRAATALLGLTFLLAVIGGPLFYVSQVIASEDAFVSVADKIAAHPEVRRAIAEEVTTLSFDAFAADEAIAAALPDEAETFAVPLTRIASTQITNAAFALLDTDIAIDARDASLRELHRQLTADGDEVEVDLRALLVRTARELGGPTLGAGVAKLVTGTDAGVFTIAEPDSSGGHLLSAVRALPDVGAAVALRRLPGDLWHRRSELDQRLATIIGDNPPLARIAVWLAGFLVIVGWSSPTVRVTFTIVGLTLASQGLVWLFTSSARRANAWRERLNIASVAIDPKQSTQRVRINLAVATVAVFLFWPAWTTGLFTGFFVFGAVLQIVADISMARQLAKASDSAADAASVASPRRQRRFAVAAAIAGILVTGLAITRVSAESTEGTSGCNGHIELCEKRVDQIVFPGSHNAMSSNELGWELALQTGDIIAQLDHGIRALLIDTHYWDNSGTVEGGDNTTTTAVIEAALADSAPQPGTWLCHGFCALGASDLQTVLADIRIWLDANPREVLLFIVQDEITTTDTHAAFESSGLGALTHFHQPGTAWPTLAQLVDDDERILVYAENEGEPDSWYQNAWNTAFTETPFTFAVRSEFSCEPNRGEPDNPLLLLNHWLTTGIPVRESAAAVNSRSALMARVEQCQIELGRLPTVVATDFVETGDLVAVVDELNDVAQ